MNLSDEIRKQIEKNKGLKLAVGEINNHLSVLEGLVRKDIMEQADEAYQRGLEDGKAQAERGCEGCQWEGRRSCVICETCCNKYQNQWQAKQTDDEIEVGDEVEALNSGSKYLIAWFAGTSLCGFAHDGVTCRLQPSDVRKTGRHFDIKSILEAMRYD